MKASAIEIAQAQAMIHVEKQAQVRERLMPLQRVTARPRPRPPLRNKMESLFCASESARARVGMKQLPESDLPRRHASSRAQQEFEVMQVCQPPLVAHPLMYHQHQQLVCRTPNALQCSPTFFVSKLCGP